MAPADAVGFVTAQLPALDEAAAAAFALVALVGRPRAEVASSVEAAASGELAGEELADALARARKALRRKLYPLPGSGWCERAERLISDRLDDALADPGPARLEVHLANCERCVEHERRLGQAQATLVADFEKAHRAKEPEPDAPPAPGEGEEPSEPPTLRIVDPQPAASTPPVPAAASAPAPATPAYTGAPVAYPVRPAPQPWSPPPRAPSPAPWTPSPPDAWRAATPRPPLAARAALESEDTWTSLGPLVAVLSVAVVTFVVAVLLVLG